MKDNEETPEIIDLTTLKDAPVLKTTERMLSVQLTEEELRVVTEKVLADAIEIAAIEVTERARRSSWNAAHKVREAAQLRIVNIASAKAEHRQVEVKVYALLDGPPDSNVALTVRTDTGEVRDRRALTVDELDELAQQPLPLPPEPEPEAKPLPKGVKALAAVIAAGEADHALDALELDTRVGVVKALKARREVLLANDIAEAEADKPKGKNP